MSEFAKLIMTTETSGLVKGKTVLGQVTKEGAKTEAQVKKTTTAIKGESTAAKGAATSMVGLTAATKKVTASNSALAVSAKQSQKATKGMAGGWRNLGLQLNQVAQVGGMTGNWMQALAVQMPDMLLGFGAIGIAAGIAAGAMIPFISTMMDGANSSKMMEENLKSLQDSLTSYRAATDLASMSTAELQDRFGTASQGLRQTIDLLSQVSKIEAQRAIDGVAESMSDLMGVAGDGEDRAGIADFFDVNIMLAFSREAKAARGEARGLTAEFLSQQRALSQAEGDITKQIAAMQGLLSATKALANAKDGVSDEELALIKHLGETLLLMQEQEAVVGKVTEKTHLWAGAMSGVKDEINAIMASLSSLAGGGIAAAGKQAEITALKAGRSIRDASRAGQAAASEAKFDQRQAQAKATGGGLLSLGLIQMERLQARQSQNLDAALDRERDLARTRDKASSGGGAGGSGGSKKTRLSEAEREAARIYDETRTAAERYKFELADLNELRKMGYLTEDTHTRAVRALGDELLNTGSLGQQMGESIEGALADVIVNFDNAKDAAAGLLNTLAKMFAQSAVSGLNLGTLFGGIFASAQGNVFSGGAPIPFAKGGVVSSPTTFPMSNSQTGLMGEAGPESIMPLKRMAGGDLGVQATGGTSVVRIELSEELIGNIIEQSAGVSLELTKAGATVQTKNIGNNITNFSSRKG